MREIDAAVALAPTSFNKRSRAVILYFSRRYDETIEQLQQVEETDPNEYDMRRWLMNAYEMKKDYPRAWKLASGSWNTKEQLLKRSRQRKQLMNRVAGPVC